MDHDPRLIADVWTNKKTFQVRTADGTFTQPKGLGLKNRGSLTKDKADTRTYKELDRPNVAGFEKPAKNQYRGRKG